MAGLLIIGAGGQGKVVAHIASALGLWDKIAFLDDKFQELTMVHEWRVVGKLSDAQDFLDEYKEAIVAVGDNRSRLGLMEKLMDYGFTFPVLVHPDASVSRHTTIGEGSVICAQAAVIIDARLGRGSIVNTGASVGHDCGLGDCVHVAPGVRLAGGVTVGDCSWIGIGAVVKEQVAIGRNVIVGAGTIVIRDVPDNVTVVGAPGRIIKQHDPVKGPGPATLAQLEAALTGPVRPSPAVTSTAPNFAGFLEPGDSRWADALRNVPHDFFHLPGYMRAAAAHEGGSPHLFLLDAGDHGMLVPLLKRPLAAFGEAFDGCFDATSPYGYPSPVYWDEHRKDRYAGLHAQFETHLQQEKVVSLFLRLNPFVGVPDTLLAPLGEVRTHGPTVYIDLRDGEMSWKGIDHSNRRFIRRALSEGCEVRMDEWGTIDQVLAAYYETMDRLNALPFYFFPKNYFEQLRELGGPSFHLATSFTPSGEVMGGVFFSEVKGLIQYFLTGTFTKFQDYSPSKLLINGLRTWGLERGHHTLHLGGGVGAHRDGLFEFKARHSKSFATFYTYRKVLIPETYRALAQAQGKKALADDFFPIYRKS
jgi:sugar O-acyltransferase (sialic acid O-acetyltransferase NeuD family)